MVVFYFYFVVTIPVSAVLIYGQMILIKYINSYVHFPHCYMSFSGVDFVSGMIQIFGVMTVVLIAGVYYAKSYGYNKKLGLLNYIEIVKDLLFRGPSIIPTFHSFVVKAANIGRLIFYF